jgi:hypothetical protein
MRIPTWRLFLTFGAVVVLAAVGIGLVAAASAPAVPPSSVVAVKTTAGPDATGEPGQPSRERFAERREALGARLLRFGRHLVHAEATVTDNDGNLITLWFDHGTVRSASGGSLTISEAGGGAETVSTDTATIVHVGREDGTLEDVSVGDEVFVQSRVDDGAALAKRILIVPARPS